jgi:O-antigen/teichoic acid export membrane protein
VNSGAFVRKLRYLRLRPFDTRSESGRRDERHRLAVLGAASNLAFRLASALSVVLAVRLTLPWLGQERFGLWALFSSLVAMLSFLDLGVGNALVNRIAAARASAEGPEGRQRERDVAVAGLAILSGFAAISLIVLSWAATQLPWSRILRIPAEGALSEEARQTALAFAWLFSAHLLSSGSLKILIGQQRMHLAHGMSAAFTLLSCLTLWWASNNRLDVPHLLVANFGVQILAGLLLWPLVLFQLRLGRTSAVRQGSGPWGFQAWRHEVPALLNTGALFLFLQIGTMITWGADSLILASVNGVAAVAVFAVGQRLFQFVSQPWGVMNAPLWAVYADAHARGEGRFIRQTLLRSLKWTFVGATLMAAIFAATGSWLVPLWTSDTLSLPMVVLLLFAAWSVLESLGNALAMYLNGCGIVRQQVVVVAALVALALPAKVLGAHWAGVPGLILASLVAYLLAVALPYATIFRRDILSPISRVGAVQLGTAAMHSGGEPQPIATEAGTSEPKSLR